MSVTEVKGIVTILGYANKAPNYLNTGEGENSLRKINAPFGRNKCKMLFSNENNLAYE